MPNSKPYHGIRGERQDANPRTRHVQRLMQGPQQSSPQEVIRPTIIQQVIHPDRYIVCSQGQPQVEGFGPIRSTSEYDGYGFQVNVQYTDVVYAIFENGLDMRAASSFVFGNAEDARQATLAMSWINAPTGFKDFDSFTTTWPRTSSDPLYVEGDPILSGYGQLNFDASWLGGGPPFTQTVLTVEPSDSSVNAGWYASGTNLLNYYHGGVYTYYPVYAMKFYITSFNGTLATIGSVYDVEIVMTQDNPA